MTGVRGFVSRRPACTVQVENQLDIVLYQQASQRPLIIGVVFEVRIGSDAPHCIEGVRTRLFGQQVSQCCGVFVFALPPAVTPV